MRSAHPCVALLALLSTVGSPFAPAQPAATAKPLPTIKVEASYAGANATVVADTVAAPIEKQVNGVEGMVQMRSRCTNDGRYVLSVAFKAGVDISISQVLVQNRVALALPVLPESVTRSGVTVRKSADVLLFVAASSPDAEHDTLYLSNYATIQVADELGRIAGVSEVRTIGQRDSGMRIWLDPLKLAARKLTAAEVVDALQRQNIQVEVGKIGQPPQPKDEPLRLDIRTKGRLSGVEDFGNIVLKAGKPEDNVVRLRDVANIVLGTRDTQNHAFLNGKEVFALAIHPLPGARPRDVSEAVRKKLAQLEERAPKGVKLDVAMDFTPGRPKAPEHCRIDVDLPATASVERTIAVLDKCQALVRKIDGVQDVLALTDPDVPHRGQLLVSLTGGGGGAERAKQIKAMRRLLHDGVADAATRVCGPSDSIATPPDYPVQFAVCEATDEGLAALRKHAGALAQRLAKTNKLIDVWASTDCMDQQGIELLIDRTKAAAQGVAVDDIFNTLEVFLGSYYVNDFNRFGKTWQVIISGNARGKGRDAKDKLGIDDLKQLMVRNKDGKMVPLAEFASSREVSGPSVIDRYGMEPMAAITANLTPGTSPAEARALCERLAADVLPAGYRLRWLREMPRKK